MPTSKGEAQPNTDVKYGNKPRPADAKPAPAAEPETGPLDVEGGRRAPDGRFEAEHRPSRQ
jgi:hypothetical protein